MEQQDLPPRTRDQLGTDFESVLERVRILEQEMLAVRNALSHRGIHVGLRDGKYVVLERASDGSFFEMLPLFEY